MIMKLGYLHYRGWRLRSSRPILTYRVLVGAVQLTLACMVTANAADRTKCYLPAPPSAPSQTIAAADQSIEQAGVFPTDALFIGASSNGGDADWLQYIALWRGHHDAPESPAIRRWLGLPQSGEVQMTLRKGRRSPLFLPWKAATFAVVQTPHFEIVTRASETDSKLVARDLERIYWVWTQLYFPLWVGRDQTAVSLSDWDPASATADDFLSQHASSRLSVRQKHRVVLLPDEQAYQLTVSIPQIAAGNAATVAASTGFYSDQLATSFFYPQAERSSIAHEVCHQLFEEATDRRRSGAATATTEDFWLVEGIAGHFESLQYGERLASVGGWDSNRLQYARYQTLIAQQPIFTIDELRGVRAEIQRRSDIAQWYSHAILHTHIGLDSDPSSPSRVGILAMLADLYGVDVTDFASLRGSEHDAEKSEQRADRFLNVGDRELSANPITGDATAICLAACEISDLGWETLPPLPHVHWFDASRTAIGDAAVQRLLVHPKQIDQLSLEATKITPAIGNLIADAAVLRELDLSWTAIDDSVVKSLEECPLLETVWLTGTPITDAAIDSILKLSTLKTIDVQRTKISIAGLQRLRKIRPEIEINPLQL